MADMGVLLWFAVEVNYGFGRGKAAFKERGRLLFVNKK
jgi:hypothetical protein